MRDGVILIDKPSGMSSFRTVKTVSRILGVRKAGHAGTLDPMATGLLVVCLGRATRISRFIMDGIKQYEGTMRLGSATDTYDAEGEVINTAPLPKGLDMEDIRRAANEFTGRLLQAPPPFSAAKHRGVPLYKLARKGKIVKKPPKEIHVMEFKVEDAGIPDVNFKITCSRGTYIRSLCHDLGQKLGCGAHMTALRRTTCGHLSIDRAVTIEQLKEAASAGMTDALVLDVSEALSHIPAISIESGDARRIRLGQGMACEKFMNALRSERASEAAVSARLVRLVTPGEAGEELVAVAKPPEDTVPGGMIRTEKVWI